MYPPVGVAFIRNYVKTQFFFYWIYFDDVWWINFTAFNKVFLHVSKTAWIKIYMYIVIFLCNAYSQYLKNSNSWNYLMIYNHGASNVYSLWNFFLCYLYIELLSINFRLYSFWRKKEIILFFFFIEKRYLQLRSCNLLINIELWNNKQLNILHVFFKNKNMARAKTL